MTSLKENLFTVLETYNTKKEARQSSLIAPWLGIKRTPAGFSQRVGNYLEDLLALDLGEKNKLILTDYKRGRNSMITHNGSNHQIDLLAIPSNWDVYKINLIIHREIKSNIEVDAGKKRDILFRDEQIK